MTTQATAIPNKYSIPLLLVLIAAGLAGNYFITPATKQMNYAA